MIRILITDVLQVVTTDNQSAIYMLIILSSINIRSNPVIISIFSNSLDYSIIIIYIIIYHSLYVVFYTICITYTPLDVDVD